MPTQPVQNKILLDNDIHINRYIWEFFPVFSGEIHQKPEIKNAIKSFFQFWAIIYTLNLG